MNSKQTSANNAAPSLSTGIENRRLPLGRCVLYFALAMAGCATDLASKEFVFHWRGLPAPDSEWWIVEGFFGIETAVNRGALFGMGAGYSWVFASLSCVAIVGIFTWLFGFKAAHDRWLTVALGLVTGGILGNLYDRLGLWDAGQLPEDFHHGVRDWILFRYGQYTWPNFNIADTLLVTGAIMLGLHAIFYREAEAKDDIADQQATANEATANQKTGGERGEKSGNQVIA